MRNFWIFQAVPERFDFQAFLASKPTGCDWLAKQGASEMRVGDGVFLWRGKGKQPEHAGLVGVAEISGKPVVNADTSASAPFWMDPADAEALMLRVPIKIVAYRNRAIDYDWLKSDPSLGDMGIFRQRQGSNFKLTTAEANRLIDIWRKI